MPKKTTSTQRGASGGPQLESPGAPSSLGKAAARRALQLGLALATAVVALGLVAAGGLVNAQQAGLSVPDWPLSYGQLLLSEWPGNTRYEQLHRLLAALTVVLALLTAGLARRGSPAARRKLAWAGAGLGLQVVIGGAVVLALAPHALVALHTVLGIVVAALFLDGAFAAAGGRGPAAMIGDPVQRSRVGRRSRWALVLVLIQLVLGAFSRHPAFGEVAGIVSLLAHALNGLAVVVVGLFLAAALLRSAPAAAKTGGGALALLVLAQLAVGATLFLVAPEPLDEPYPPERLFVHAHVAHLVVASVLLGLLLILASREGRPETEP